MPAHHATDNLHHVAQERLLEAQLVPVARSATEDLPDDVTPPLVARQRAVRDAKRHRAHMVRDATHPNVLARVAPVSEAALCAQVLEVWLEQIRLEVVRRALQHGGDPLEA